MNSSTNTPITKKITLARFACLCLSFCYLFTAVIDLLLGLLPVQKRPREHHRNGQFLPWSSRNFAPSFSLKFLRISGHISGPTKLIILFLLQKLSKADANLGQRWWPQKWNKDTGGYGRDSSQWVKRVCRLTRYVTFPLTPRARAVDLSSDIIVAVSRSWSHNAKMRLADGMGEALTTNCQESKPLTSWWWLKHCRNVWAFSIYQKFRTISIGTFRFGQARFICHKSHSFTGPSLSLHVPDDQMPW